MDELIFHWAATPEGKDFAVADIAAWHKVRGFNGHGYHYVIYRDRSVMVACPVGQVRAHCAGHNTGAIGISYIGGVSADGKPPRHAHASPALFHALARPPAHRQAQGHPQVLRPQPICQ
jgi:N-acetylmuramoyl-L-alanine amidase